MPRVKIKSYDRKKNRTHDAARTCTLHTFTLCSIAPVQTNSERSIFEFNTLSEAKYDSLICCCTKDTCGVSCCNRCTQHDDNLPHPSSQVPTPNVCRSVSSPTSRSPSHTGNVYFTYSAMVLWVFCDFNLPTNRMQIEVGEFVPTNIATRVWVYHSWKGLQKF